MEAVLYSNFLVTDIILLKVRLYLDCSCFPKGMML
jgi:hypothetical protein